MAVVRSHGRVAAVQARVVANEVLCREHVWIEVELPAFPSSQPGQFLELRCAPEHDGPPRLLTWPADGFPAPAGAEWGSHEPFLRRPFSIADHWTDSDGRAHLVVISRTVGAGTRRLEQLRPGDTLDLTGPLGRGFCLPAQPTPIVLLGGGVGIPPLYYTARRLAELDYRYVTLILGATRRDLLPARLMREPRRDGTPAPCLALPGGAAYPVIVTSDDGSIGLPGLATDGLRYWRSQRADAAGALVLACGPEPMLRAAAGLTRTWGLACQLCIERNMGCGLGTCLSCVVKLHDPAAAEGWRWGLACLDGPVFARDELLDFDPGPPP